MFKLDLEKAQESEIKLPTSVGASKKQENSRKSSTSVLWTMPKPLALSLFGVGIKTGLFQSVGTAEFSKFAGN